MKKSEQKKQLIQDTALELFREHGYEKTTMRLIAKRADIALGSVYYYYPSKEHIVIDFYDVLHKQILLQIDPIIQKHQKLEDRIYHIISHYFDSYKPYREIYTILVQTAFDPKSNISPFRPETSHIKDSNIAVYKKALQGFEKQFHTDFWQKLPTLFWFYYMGLFVFWIQDTSDNQKQTQEFLKTTVKIFIKTLKITSLPFMKNFRTQILNLSESIFSLANTEFPLKKESA